MNASLNRMVLDAITSLTTIAGCDFVTAREIKECLSDRFDAHYQIQTIIVVLNRFRDKGLVQRITFAGQEVRERYGYYLPFGTENMRQDTIRQRFQALADEFYDGNTNKALQELTGLIERSSAPADCG